MNPYATHPTSRVPDEHLLSFLTSAQQRCIGGSIPQMKCSQIKGEMTGYRDEGLRMLFRVRGTLFANSWRTVLAVILVAVVLVLSHEYAGEWIVFHDKPHTLTIIPIGFLLVFRSNLSYGRWWDGRGMIGQMVFACRIIAVKFPNYIKGPEDQMRALVKQVMQLAMAMVVAIRHAVQKRSAGEMKEEVKQAMATLYMWELSHYLSPEQCNEVREASGVPAVMVICRLLTTALVSPTCSTSTIRYRWPTAVDDLVRHAENILAAWQGMMKIVTTPMPFPYAHSLEIFLNIWVYTVPLILIDNAIGMQWITVPVCAVVAVLLFGINNVGSEIEDPFGNDVNDFDLVMFQRSLHNELKGIYGEEIWASSTEPFS